MKVPMIIQVDDGRVAARGTAEAADLSDYGLQVLMGDRGCGSGPPGPGRRCRGARWGVPEARAAAVEWLRRYPDGEASRKGVPAMGAGTDMRARLRRADSTASHLVRKEMVSA